MICLESLQRIIRDPGKVGRPSFSGERRNVPKGLAWIDALDTVEARSNSADKKGRN